MLIVAFKPAHDGGVAVVEDGHVRFCLEPEKDSGLRQSALTPATVLGITEQLDRVPDVVAVGGWLDRTSANRTGPDYRDPHALTKSESRFLGQVVTHVNSSHVRSHIYCALGMAPKDELGDLQAVLVWEGGLGAFYLVDSQLRVVRTIPVMDEPGLKYETLFAICDTKIPPFGAPPRPIDAGKLMALAAYGSRDTVDAEVAAAVDRLLASPVPYPFRKDFYAGSPLYDSGVTSSECKNAAWYLTDRIFKTYATVAAREIPPGIPLLIAGGCGLNCEWNARWRELGHFSSVFVPPCPNDSGSALGTAIDAQAAITGSPHVSWDVYAGLEFVRDSRPDPARWRRRDLDDAALASAIASGRVVAWVQGRWELGPRALGNRSLLAEPTRTATRDRLNEIKKRESYRPVAPCARVEDLSSAFASEFDDPYMLYFRGVRDPRLRAITHVDGSARVQTVSRAANGRLHDLLTAFRHETGHGVLCNTSLNFPGLGFINRMSDLVRHCEDRRVDDMVVGGDWFERVGDAPAGA